MSTRSSLSKKELKKRSQSAAPVPQSASASRNPEILAAPLPRSSSFASTRSSVSASRPSHNFDDDDLQLPPLPTIFYKKSSKGRLDETHADFEVDQTHSSSQPPFYPNKPDEETLAQHAPKLTDAQKNALSRKMRRNRNLKIAGGGIALAALIAGVTASTVIITEHEKRNNNLRNDLDAARNASNALTQEHFTKRSVTLNAEIEGITTKLTSLNTLQETAQRAAQDANSHAAATARAAEATAAAASQTPPDTLEASTQAATAESQANLANTKAANAQAALAALNLKAAEIQTKADGATSSAQQTIDEVTTMQTRLQEVKDAATAAEAIASAAKTTIAAQKALVQIHVETTTKAASDAKFSAELAQKNSANAQDYAAGRPLTYPNILTPPEPASPIVLD